MLSTDLDSRPSFYIEHQVETTQKLFILQFHGFILGS